MEINKIFNNKLKEVRIKISQCDLNKLGYTHAAMKITKIYEKFKLILKSFLSPDYKM